jgi:hypothetical protein
MCFAKDDSFMLLAREILSRFGICGEEPLGNDAHTAVRVCVGRRPHIRWIAGVLGLGSANKRRKTKYTK